MRPLKTPVAIGKKTTLSGNFMPWTLQQGRSFLHCACVQDKTSVKINTCLSSTEDSILIINNVCILHLVCNDQMEGHLEQGATNSGATVLCRSVFEEGGTFNSTKGKVTVRVGDGGEQGEGV